MKISELPEEIRKVALLRQQEEKGSYYNKETDNLQHAFEWSETTEGDIYWSKYCNTEPDTKEIESTNGTENFEKTVTETLDRLKELLIIKGKEYRRNGNAYHNFDEGAKITGLIPERVLDGFLLKHEISIKDMVNDIDLGILPSVEKVNEKFDDNLIYLLLKKAMILERINKTKNDKN
jgi:hypothetical protein